MTKEITKQDLDDAICAHLRHEAGHPTDSLALEEMAAKVYPKASVLWRAIDRRIQAMRKAGRLRYDKTSRAWIEVTE